MLKVEFQEKQIILTKTVFDIFRYFQRQEKEKGGIVLGQISENERQILVCRVSVPGDQDSDRRRSFRRDWRQAQHIIEYEFYNSGGKNTYLGEWHTHPANKAIPSPQDIQMITEQFATNKMKVRFILLFVVALEELLVGLYDGQKMYSATIQDFYDYLA